MFPLYHKTAVNSRTQADSCIFRSGLCSRKTRRFDARPFWVTQVSDILGPDARNPVSYSKKTLSHGRTVARGFLNLRCFMQPAADL